MFVYRCQWHADGPTLVDVSADQRYKLYLDGRLLGVGPARGDLEHWPFDTYELPAEPGPHELLSLVWNFGWLAPMAQISLRTGFVCRSERPELCTPGAWQVARHPGWSFERRFRRPSNFYCEVGPAETIDPSQSPVDWRDPHVIVDWRDRGSRWESIWAMTPRTIPPMTLDPTPHGSFVVDGSHVLDAGELLNAYPRLRLSGPAGARLRVTYDEALWETSEQVGAYGNQFIKGRRDQPEGKEGRGMTDEFVLGADPVQVEPLHWRTYRYLTLESETPICVESLDSVRTGYPYAVKSYFRCDDPEIERIWEVAVRTARRCAGETYFDCPGYEQLQYAGDTRIQALLHAYLSSDRRLSRQAIQQFAWSAREGLPQSRYPNRTTQFIPPFALWWVAMLHDQWMHDPSPGIDSALVEDAGLTLLAYDQSARRGDHWFFGDWVPGWEYGVPPGGPTSTLHRMTRVLAGLAHAEMAQAFGARAVEDAASLAATYSDEVEAHGEFMRWKADEAWRPSEHAEALARLIERRLGLPHRPWPHGAMDPTTLYFAHYKHQAMRPGDYLAQLHPWRAMLGLGLTTFAETPEPARSDCHAWSAHPALGLLSLVAGVEPSAPGWSRARIEPKPGRLAWFEACVDHPQGPLLVEYRDGALRVDCPVPFELVVAGRGTKHPAGEVRLDA